MKKLKYVNIYLIDRAYGGPEEGGWYFDYGVFIGGEAVEPSRERINKAIEIADKYCDKENEDRNDDIGSVLSEGKYVVYVEDEPGRDWPEEKPHYE